MFSHVALYLQVEIGGVNLRAVKRGMTAHHYAVVLSRCVMAPDWRTNIQDDKMAHTNSFPAESSIRAVPARMSTLARVLRSLLCDHHANNERQGAHGRSYCGEPHEARTLGTLHYRLE